MKTPSKSTPPRKLITISIPVYNEADNIERLLHKLREIANQASKYDFEFLFTDNASEDSTFQKLEAAAAGDTRIRVMRFSRNFGFQRSILANFLAARGDAAIQIDADLQDPPELMLEFLALWEKGFKVVYGIRRSRIESRRLQLGRKLFYRIVDHISEVSVPPDAGDFRLIDRDIINHLGSLKDRSPYLRGFIAGLGYPQVGIPYDRAARIAGSSKFRLPSLVKLAIDGVCSQSTLPLHYITLFGILICAVAAIVTVLAIVVRIAFPESIPAGLTTLLVLLLFSIGMNSLFVGIIGEYVGRIFDNVRAHPLTIVETIIDRSVKSEPSNGPKTPKKSTRTPV